MHFPRVLNLKSDTDQVTMLRRMMGTGFAQVPPAVVARILAEKSEKNMRSKVRQALKRGVKITVEDLVAELKGRPDFLGFCEKELGLNMAFFEGLAETAIKEGGK